MQYDIRHHSEWSCRFQRFFVYVSLDTSAWILAAISIERFLAVCMPHKHKLLKSTSRAWKVVIGIIIFQVAFNSHVFFNYGSQTVTKDNVTTTFACGYSSDAAREYLTVYHSWISMAVYCFIPFCTMLILNIFIIAKMRLMQAALKSRCSASTTSRRSQANTLSMTRMLLCVTFYFILVTTPAFIFAIFQEWLFKNTEITPEKYGQIEVVDAVLTILLYLNHSINFLLYCVSGRRFRRELITMLKCNKGKDDNRPSGTGTKAGGTTTDTLLVDKVTTTQ